MGVLEDAIREHLELKRRHGASDEELEEQEVEALGPARRGFDGPAEGEEVEGEEVVPELEPEPEPELEPAESEAAPVDEAESEVHESETRIQEPEPDFDQEPDDQRLWSEQRSPRDLDFD